MPATINVQVVNNYYDITGLAAPIIAAFDAWLSHFDYTTGSYTINVSTYKQPGGNPSGVLGGGDTYVQVGAAGGKAVLEPLFGLNVVGRNGDEPDTPPLALSFSAVDPGDEVAETERDFENALGVRSFQGYSVLPSPAGGDTVYDGALTQTTVTASPTNVYQALSFNGPNAEAVFGGPVPLLSMDGSFVSLAQGAAGASVNQNSYGQSPASSIQPLDVAMLRDAGLPALSDQEVVEHQIARLYFAAYGRVATGAELTASTMYYQAALAAGATAGPAILATIGAALASGSVFAGEHGQLSDADFVRVAYQNTFGRAVDGQLQSAITQYLASAGTAGRGAVLASLTDTDEARGRLSANPNVTYSGTVEAQTARLYDTAFGRAADPGGYAQYTRALINGLTLKQAAVSFLGSGEFATRYGASPSDQALVDGLYQNTLGRAPDAAGEAQYVRALASGGFDRADLVVAFSESSEHIALMAQRVGATDAAGLFLSTQTPLGLVPVLSGTAVYPSGGVTG